MPELLPTPELALPWLEMTILLPLLGAIWVSCLRSSQQQRLHALVFSGLAFVSAVGACSNFLLLETFEAGDCWDLLSFLFDDDLFVIDKLNAPLIPLAALLYFLTQLATSQTKVRRFPFGMTLLSEAILLATLSAHDSVLLVGLLVLGTLPVYWELKQRQKPTRVYTLHMGLFAVLLITGQVLLLQDHVPSDLAVILLTLAVLLRNGVIPVHCWITDLFEHASFGTALLFVTPMVGVYGVMRLVFPIAPEWILQSIAVLSLITALYASGMAIVQREARRFFTYLFLSYSSLVLVGLEIATPMGLTGAFCIWLSVGLSLAGFGLTLRCIEARTGRLSLEEYHGLYEKTPFLAGFFLLTGMASIGFPGTIGFIGMELLIDGTSEISLWMETVVVITAAINSIAVVYVYFRVFTGKIHPAAVDLRCKMRERIAVLILSLLILGGGLYPQPGIASRYHAATELLEQREDNLTQFAVDDDDDDDDEDDEDDEDDDDDDMDDEDMDDDDDDMDDDDDEMDDDSDDDDDDEDDDSDEDDDDDDD